MNIKRFLTVGASRKRAIYLLKFESLLILGIVIYLLVAPLFSTVSEVDALSAEIVFGLLGSVGLWASAIGFEKQKSFGRAPAVLANLIALGVSYYMVMGSFLYVGIPLMLLSIVTILSAALGYKE
jgi:hypothetical protein